MGRWVFMLGGLLVWMLHFGGVYAIASIADVVSQPWTPASRWTVAGFTAICAIAAGALGLAGLRRLRAAEGDPFERFSATVAAVGGGIATVAVIWQGLPALVGHGG